MLYSMNQLCCTLMCVNYMMIVSGLSVIILVSHNPLAQNPWVIRPLPLITPYNLLSVQNVTLVLSANHFFLPCSYNDETQPNFLRKDTILCLRFKETKSIQFEIIKRFVRR
jgi:hypothetical protein